MTAQGLTDAKGRLPDEFIHQALKEVVMHEVGHTLGLRHNFKASSWKTLKEISDPKRDPKAATVASVMDYIPANISAKNMKTGTFYTPTIGPYDYWAIEYGYKPFSSTKEKEELAKIASRGAEDGHDYASDEDASFLSPDPLTNRFDLGKQPLDFVERQMKTVQELLPKVVEKSVQKGEGYQKARQAFGMMLSEYWSAAQYATQFPGGVYVHRDHKGDPKARPPFKVVDVKDQRKGMELLTKTVFAPPSYDAGVLNHLAASRWWHWGSSMSFSSRVDYPIVETTTRMQRIILSDLFSSIKLQRIHDSELKVPLDQDAYTVAEHLRLLVDGIFTEWKGEKKEGQFQNRKPYIALFRRSLQRLAIQRLTSLVLSSSSGPEDARTLALMHLKDLDAQVTALLKNNKLVLDDYSRAHLIDSQNRIQQVLNSKLDVTSVR